jgi:hypothetical protein
MAAAAPMAAAVPTVAAVRHCVMPACEPLHSATHGFSVQLTLLICELHDGIMACCGCGGDSTAQPCLT